ncbi:MAG TPA: hypothetical protein VLK29_09270 [Luteimonas sp.]|nr:hypothetical protein [Luteimonas sp.]
MTALRTCLLSTALLAACLASASAGAVDVARTSHFNAPAFCQASLPAYDAGLRKRPLGLQNEGDSVSFVTCALATENFIDAVEVYLSSHDGTEAEVTCTLVNGYNYGTNEYITKSVVTDADDYVGMVFLPEDFIDQEETFPSAFVSLSCALPPGTGLNDMWIRYSEDVGA